MARYIAKMGNGEASIYTKEALENYFANGYDIIRRDDDVDTVIASNKEWIEPKPDVEGQNEFVYLDVTPQVRQISADLAYISMMTGVAL